MLNSLKTYVKILFFIKEIFVLNSLKKERNKLTL